MPSCKSLRSTAADRSPPSSTSRRRPGSPERSARPLRADEPCRRGQRRLRGREGPAGPSRPARRGARLDRPHSGLPGRSGPCGSRSFERGRTAAQDPRPLGKACDRFTFTRRPGLARLAGRRARSRGGVPDGFRLPQGSSARALGPVGERAPNDESDRVTMMLTCPKVACGMQTPAPAVFCEWCGARLGLTPREMRDAGLLPARKLTKALVAERPKRHYGTCAYCGRPCLGEVCAQHRDLARQEHEEQRGVT